MTRLTIFSLPKRRTFFDNNYYQPYKLFCKAGKIFLDIFWTLTGFDNSSSSSYSVFIRCFPFSRDGRIYPIPSAILRTPSLHLSRLRASSFFKPIFSVSSSTCFFQVFFGRPRSVKSNNILIISTSTTVHFLNLLCQ